MTQQTNTDDPTAGMNPLEQLIYSYTGAPNPNEETPQPRNFVIECNKQQSVQDGNKDNPNEWTNTFPSIKLKRGDIVSVNSAFLSSRGSGDLLQFDATNNKARLIFEYYSTHDNTNNKRAEYNMNYTQVPSNGAGSKNVVGWDCLSYYDSNANDRGLPCYMNCLPPNYRAMRMYRLMKTFDRIESTANKNVYGEGDGSDLPAFTDPTTTPSTVVKESFWGYNNSPSMINGSKEDEYVPCLIRNPKINIDEHYITQNNDSTNLFTKKFPDAKIWYVSTQKSHLSPPASFGEASMRIHFAGTGGAYQRTDRANTLNDSLGLVQSLRVGQYIKFWGTKATFGICAYNQKSHTANSGVNAYGPNLYYASGYVFNNQGFNATSDNFVQLTAKDSVPLNHKGTWKQNPMGMVMKITKIYVNASPDYPAGNNTLTEIGSGKADIEYCPYIEVACDSAISLAWGNPNAYTWADNPHGIGSPYHNGPWNATPTATTIPPFSYICHETGLNIRTWNSRNYKRVDLTTADGSNVLVSSANRFPIEEHTNVDCYLASISHYANFNTAVNVGRTGLNAESKESQLELNGSDQSLFTQATTGNNDTTTDNSLGTSLPAINYNFNTFNTDMKTQNNEAYADEYVASGEYAGGRLPNYYVENNDPDLYNSDNYWKLTRESSSSMAGAIYPMYIQNLADPSTTSNNYNGANASDNYFESSKGLNPSETLPEWGSEAVNHSGLYLTGAKGKPIKFFLGANIDNTTEGIDLTTGFHSYSYNDTLQGEALTGMDNFIIQTANLPPPETIGQQTDPPSNQPNTTIIKKNYTLWGGFKSYTPAPNPASPTSYPEWVENHWTTGTIKETIVDASGNNLNTYTIDCDKGDLDMNILMSQFESCVYIKVFNKFGETEVMYVQIFTGYFNENDTTAPYFQNSVTTGGKVKAFINKSGDANMVVGDKTIVRMYIIKRDVLNTGKMNFQGYFNQQTGANTNKINVDNVQTNPANHQGQATSLAQMSYFYIMDDLADMIHTYDFAESPKQLLPTNQLILSNCQNFKAVVGGNAGERNGYLGSDFVVTSIPNQPYYDEDNSIENMTTDMIWLYDDNIKYGDPSTTTTTNGKKIGSQNELTWGIHYDFIDLQLDPDVVYYSTSDIANEVTKQLQAPADLYKSNNTGGRNPTANGVFPNTAGKYPVNSLFRPINGPSASDNIEDTSAMTLGGSYHEGDFCWFVAVQKQYWTNFNVQDNWKQQNNPYFVEGPPSFFKDFAQTGFYKVFPQNGQTPVNREPTTNDFFLDGWTKVPFVGQAQVQALTGGYRQKQLYVGNGGRIEPDDFYGLGIPDFYGYEQTTMTQYAGTNTATLIYNDQFSRFEFQYLHQPLYSRMTAQNQSTSDGGNLSCNVWENAVVGMDVWDRVGGINVVNWCAKDYDFGDKTGSETDYLDPLTQEDPIGQAFMNKLGFTASWRQTNSGSTTYAEDFIDNKTDTRVANLGYKPLGTTRSDYNVNQAISYTSLSQQNRPAQGNHTDYILDSYGFPGEYPADAGPQYLNKLQTFNAQQGGNAYVGNGTNVFMWNTKLGVTLTNPNGYLSPAHPPTLNGTIDDGAYLSYRNGGYEFAPPDYAIDTSGTQIIQANLDDIKCRYYQYQVSSNGLRAPDLPTKNEIGYFFIMSDLVDKHEFYGSANEGSNLNAIAILSKNYTSNDFFFSFQSPVQFHIKQDKTITSITNRILTPSLQAPVGIDNNSSIIYSIERPNPVPEPDVPPVFLQQAYDYYISQQLALQQGIPFQGFMGGSALGSAQQSSAYAGSGGSLNTLRQALVQSVLNPSGTQASQILQTETEIAGTLARMPLASRIRAIRQQGVAEDPSQAVVPTIPAEQLGLQPQVQTIPDIQDPAIDPQVLAREMELVNQGQIPLVGKKDESDDLGAGRSASGLPAYNPLRENTPPPMETAPPFDDIPSRTLSEEARAREQYGVATPFETMPPSFAPTRKGSREQTPREISAERKSVERIRSGGKPPSYNPLGDLADRLKEEQGGMSLYNAVAMTTGTHPTMKSKKAQIGDWTNKSKSNWGDKTKPNENPYDIRTWTSGRLNSWKNDHFFHLKDKYRPSMLKKEAKAGETGFGENMIRHKDLAFLSQEIQRRKDTGSRALNYGKTDRKGKPDEPPAYKKEGDRPAGWTNHDTAHQHPRGISAGDKPHAKNIVVLPSEPSVSSGIASSNV